MLPTPSTTHVNYAHIYEPAEDSYVLLDTLSSPTETTFLHQRFSANTTATPTILEIGVGSGVVLAFVAANAEHIFGRPDLLALGTDVNAYAASAAAQTVRVAVAEKAAQAGVFGDCVVGDLASPLRARTIDVLIFNPPYVPTEDLPSMPNSGSAETSSLSKDNFARDSHLLALSYAGGVDGMETTNRLLQELQTILNERGVAYILLCKQNRPEAVMTGILSWPGGWVAKIVGSSGKKAGWERLCILRIWRP
ncbi:hypothetical protein LTR62_008124 [Meristemomyces frigidus]|uniref:Methyltransferase small domain-containing protein n=1 Tax=Meristemomyces frigidus TaxID=1508187 RepID=A0AAN7TDY2_9PEZI|nr:hypothetical protein LTR62_008124 [Meristemomyces frigidus]